MVKLSRTRLTKRSLLFVVFFIAIIAGVFVAAKSIKMFQAEAAGGQATVNGSDDLIYYDDTATYRYSVTVDGSTYNALCAEPSKLPPGGDSYSYSTLNNNKIKLLVFLATSNSASANNLVNALYGDLASTSDKRFAYIHATIGAINGDYNGLNENYNKIYNIANGTGSSSIAYAISSNSDAWLIAKNYTLYATNPSDSSYQSVVWIKSTPSYGAITVQKCDSETQSCTTPQGKASFSGISFEVYNASGSRFYNPNTQKFYNNGALITSGTTNSSGKVTFSNLPTGIQYRVKEASTNNSYLLTASDQTTASLTTNGTTLKFYDEVIRGDVKFTKVDQNNNSTPMANIPFRITSKTTNESHIVVSDFNGVVNTATIIHSLNTNGYDSLSNNPSSITYQDNIGTWFGTLPAMELRGALPYDEYTVAEIACDQNQYCYSINAQQKSFTISQNETVVNLGTWNNNCADFSLETSASDNADDDEFVLASDTAEIKDTVSYCLREGLEYTITGVLMDKATGEELKINGQSVTASKTFTPTTACGNTDIIFSFDASELAGQDIVVYESLYHGDELLAEHKDIDDASQTVTIISLGTTAVDGLDDDKFIEAGTDSVLEDTITYCLQPNVEYAIHGILMDKSTGEALLVDGETVENEIIINPTEACGTTKMEFELDTTELGGKEIVVFESAAIEIFQNQPTEGDEPQEDKTYREIISHEDLEDEGQTIDVIDLHTYAVDNSDGDKILPVNDTTAVIKDTVYYHLKAGEEYVFHGILMNKDTGLPVGINGQIIEQTIKFTPEENSGEFDVFYEVDTTGLGGATLVILEELSYNGETIISHTDFENQSETVTVAPNPPETGTISRTSQGNVFGIGTFPLALSAVGLGSYVIFRFISRKKFYRK